MSIFESLLRFIDIIEFRNKQEERRVKRKEQPPGDDDDVDVEVPPSRPEPAGAPLQCRICGYSGGPEHRFCPRCLAETMERQR